MSNSTAYPPTPAFGGFVIPSPTTPVNPQQPPIPPPPPVPPTYSSNTNTGSETVAHFKRGDSKRGSIANSDRKPLSFNWREEGAPITSSTDKSIRQRSQEEEREEGELSDDEMGGVDPITTAVTNGTASATISNPVLPPNPFMWPNPFGDTSGLFFNTMPFLPMFPPVVPGQTFNTEVSPNDSAWDMTGTGVAPFVSSDAILTSPMGISPTHFGGIEVNMDASILANPNIPMENRLEEGRQLLRKAVEDIARLRLTSSDLVREGISPIFIRGILNQILQELGHPPLPIENEPDSTASVRVTPKIKKAIERIKEQANDSMETDGNLPPVTLSESKLPPKPKIPNSLPPIPPALNPTAVPFTIPGLQTVVPGLDIPGLQASLLPATPQSAIFNGDASLAANSRKRPGGFQQFDEKAPKRKFGSFVKDPSLIFEVTDDEDEAFTAKENNLLREKEKVAQTLQNYEESILALKEQLKLKMTPVTTPSTPTMATANGNSYLNKGKSNATTPPEKTTTPNQSVGTPTLEEATAALKREKERLMKQEELAKIRAKLEETQAQKRKEEAAKTEIERQRMELVKAQARKDAEAAEEKQKSEEEAKEREAAEKQLRNERNRQEAEKKREELLAKLKESRENKRRQEEEAKRKEEEHARQEEQRIEKETQEKARAAAPLQSKKAEQLRLQLEQMAREDEERQRRREQMLAQLNAMDINSSSTSGPEAGEGSSAKSEVVVSVASNDQQRVDRQQTEAPVVSEADSDAMDIDDDDDEPEANAPIITHFSGFTDREATPVASISNPVAHQAMVPEAVVESSESDDASLESSSSDSDSGSESDDEDEGEVNASSDEEDDEESWDAEDGETKDPSNDGEDDDEDSDGDIEKGFKKSDSPIPQSISNPAADETVADAQEDLIAPVRPSVLADLPKQEDKKSTLTPYESPLKMFKFYRLTNNFHAKNGYRSLTYSNKVDPSKPFCKYETSGGTCKDKKCPNQHWRDISKTDDEILLELGSKLEGDTPEQQEIYRSGLRDLIGHLKEIDSADFEAAVTAIGEFWRVFKRNPIEKPDITKEPFTSLFAKLMKESATRKAKSTPQ